MSLRSEGPTSPTGKTSFPVRGTKNSKQQEAKIEEKIGLFVDVYREYYQDNPDGASLNGVLRDNVVKAAIEVKEAYDEANIDPDKSWKDFGRRVVKEINNRDILEHIGRNMEMELSILWG